MVVADAGYVVFARRPLASQRAAPYGLPVRLQPGRPDWTARVLSSEARPGV